MRIDYDSLRTANAIPCAASMIETFRAIGYNIETAVADIIDNSISANAKKLCGSQDIGMEINLS